MQQEPICPPEILAELKPRKCPACDADCIPRQGGFSKHRWFMGCPKYPRCPGKAPSLTLDSKGRATKKLSRTYAFINHMGSIKEAEAWLKVAAQIILIQKGKTDGPPFDS